MINFNSILSEAIALESVGKTLYHGSGMDFSKFDTSKSASATEFAHHGYGIYLVDDSETAKQYIKQYAVGGKGTLYTCRILNDYNIVLWDDMIPLDEFMNMAEEIEEFDESLAIEMKEYPEGYHGETFTYGDLYDLMKNIKGHENPNNFFEGFGIDGFSGGNRINPDATEYCIFSTEGVKILDKERVSGER